MSKSKVKVWKALPNWENEEEYLFLNYATLPEWAWEFLRRNPAYVHDFELAHGILRRHGGQSLYEPPKNKDETEERYVCRMINSGSSYKITRFDAQCAKKWGIAGMYPPDQPFAVENLFQGTSGIPRIVTDISHLEDYCVGADLHDASGNFIGTRSVPHDDVAIAIFDLNAPLEQQCQKIQQTLFELQKHLKSEILKQERSAGQISKWKRHIRVLDARRSNPPATYKKISEILGGKKSVASKQTHEDRGTDFFGKAVQQMENYRKILLHSPLKLSS